MAEGVSAWATFYAVPCRLRNPLPQSENRRNPFYAVPTCIALTRANLWAVKKPGHKSMPSGKLTTKGVAALLAKGEPKAHADGGNLYLKITGPGRGKWALRYMVAGRAREMGLGTPETVTLAAARQGAQDALRAVSEGKDPIAQRKAVSEARKAEARALVHTFDDVAALYIAAHKDGWRNAKHAAQWTATLGTYASPKFGRRDVSGITTSDVLDALEPIWRAKPETASRLRGRIEAILNYAKARGWRAGENPAAWRGHLANLLPARGKVQRVQHHPALPWQEMPEFWARLARQDGLGALALRFAILTAARSGEVRGATWGEIDLKAATWTVDGARMKAGRTHRVPLSGAALAVLEAVRVGEPQPSGFVFPSPARSKPTPLSDMTLAAVLKRMRRSDLSVHGFRSTFRDWTAEATQYPRDVAEMALAHTIGDKVEAAYRRGDLFAKRTALMADWSRFVSGSIMPQNELAAD